MTRVLLAAALAAVATTAGAQSTPNIMKPKQAAQRAVAATNASVAANSTLPDDKPGAAQAQRPTGRHMATDSASGSTAVTASSPAAVKGEKKGSSAPAFERETFAYERGGRRDPFVSLMNTSELRPYVSDLRLVAVAYDERGRNSVAVLRDLGTKEQYRVRTGQSLGRMHVASIAPKAVVFTIEEFGYSRQETLALGDSNTGVKK